MCAQNLWHIDPSLHAHYILVHYDLYFSNGSQFHFCSSLTYPASKAFIFARLLGSIRSGVYCNFSRKLLGISIYGYQDSNELLNVPYNQTWPIDLI